MYKILGTWIPHVLISLLPSQIHNLPGKTCTLLAKPGSMCKSSVSRSTSQPKPGVVAPARETKHINICAVCKIMHRSAADKSLAATIGFFFILLNVLRPPFCALTLG